MFDLTINTTAGRRRLRVLAESYYGGLLPVLRDWDKFKRGEIDDIIASEGAGKWPPLAKETAAAKPTAERVELMNVVRGIGPRGGSRIRRQGVLKLLDQAARFEMRAERARTEKARTTALIRAKARTDTLQSIVNIWGGSAKIRDVDALVNLAERDLLTRARRRAKLIGKARYRNEEASTKMLGQLGKTFRSTIQDGTWTFDSSWPIAGVHNEGATVGRGARIPERRFAELTPENVELLVQLLVRHGIAAFEAA